MGRSRSRDAESQSVNRRMMRDDSVKRGAIERWAIGADEVRPGTIGSDHLGKQAVRAVNIDPALIMRECLVLDHGSGPVTIGTSHSLPCRIGGRPVVVIVVDEDNPSTAGDIVVELFRNGVLFGEMTLPEGEVIVSASFDTIFARFDRPKASITEAGTDATGLNISFWFE